MSETEGVDRTLDCNVSSMIIYCIVSVGFKKKKKIGFNFKFKIGCKKIILGLSSSRVILPFPGRNMSRKFP